MSMPVKQVTPGLVNSAAVHGLQGGRELARRQAGRRRIKNAIVSGVMFLIAAGIVGTAGYYLWQFYGDEQERNAPTGPIVADQTTEEWIEELEEQPRWNGPGAPDFGVGDEQP